MNHLITEALNFINEVQGKKFKWKFYNGFAYINSEKIKVSAQLAHLLTEFKFGIEIEDDYRVLLHTEIAHHYDVTTISNEQIQEVRKSQLMCYDSAFVKNLDLGEHKGFKITSDIPFRVLNKSEYLNGHTLKRLKNETNFHSITMIAL